ncbi:MAG: hypothetical protein ACRC0F_06715 [Cetobacterium sp.]
MIGVAIYNDGMCEVQDTIKVRKTFVGEEVQLFGRNGAYFIGVDYCTWVTEDDREVLLTDFCLLDGDQYVSYKAGEQNDFI